MKVAIAVDESKVAENAFDWYITNFHRPENEIVVISEAEQPGLPTVAFAGGAGFPAEEIGRIMTEHNKKRADLENIYTMKCKQHKLKYKIFMETTKHKPGHAIIKKAEEMGIEMIVMGSRGMGLVRRTVLGSVSDYVLHHSKIPVMICRSAQDDEIMKEQHQHHHHHHHHGHHHHRQQEQE